MSAAIAIPGSTAATFLTHFFGPGLVVERFQTMADGDIRPWPAKAAARKGRSAKRVTATLKAVRDTSRAAQRIADRIDSLIRDGMPAGATA